MSKNITIVGGGLVGLISAALLANNKFFVNIIEANPKNFKLEDAKALALSNSSVFILKKLRIWEDLLKNTTPIKEIHVSQKNSFGRTLFKSEDYEEDALGYIVSYSSLMNLLRNKVEKLCNTQIISNAKAESIQESDGEKQVVIKREKSHENIPFNLLVLADGGKSSIKGIELIREEKNFEHIALVALIQANKSHNGRAYERFTSKGPIALLPNISDRFTLVWTGPENYIRELESSNNNFLLQKLQENFGNRVGKFISINERSIFPLKSSILKNISNPDVIAIGNASQIIHPVAGQGLNIGIRDALELSKHINFFEGRSFPKNVARDFNKIRENKSAEIIKITDQLSSFFLEDIIGLNTLRGLSLSILDIIPPIKNRFVKKMSYGE